MGHKDNTFNNMELTSYSIKLLKIHIYFYDKHPNIHLYKNMNLF